MNSIDRIEDGYAVLETDEGLQSIPLTDLPADAKEGDILQKTESGWIVDAERTQARREQLAARRRRMRGEGNA